MPRDAEHKVERDLPAVPGQGSGLILDRAPHPRRPVQRPDLAQPVREPRREPLGGRRQLRSTRVSGKTRIATRTPAASPDPASAARRTTASPLPSR